MITLSSHEKGQSMATPASSGSQTFPIGGTLWGSPVKAQLTLQGGDGSPLAAAVAANTPFPSGKVSLGGIALAASTGETIPFSAGPDKGTVAFKASASGFYEAGIYPNASDLLHDLSPERDIASGLALPAVAGSRFLMLRCGYDASITAKGAMALGFGATANFGASASSAAAFAVIHRVDDGDGARDVLAETAGSWILPNQIDGPDRLAPGTWLIAEVDGSVALHLGIQAGYDYSWLRQFADGALKGDLGLRVQLAANAALGFSATGSFAVAVSRDTDAPVIRLRLFRLAKNGWNFALNASAGEQVELPDIFQPGHDIKELISAVFGVHVAQLVEDLSAPGISSASSVAKFIEQRGMKEFQSLTGVSPDQLFAAGKAKVDELIDHWNALTNKPATMLAAILKKDQDVEKLVAFLNALQGKDDSGVKALIAKALGSPDFFQTVVGKWIESVVPTTSLAAVTGPDDWKIVQELSARALQIVNGQTLQSLIDYAAKELGLDNIQKVRSDVDAFNLDPWLQAKLAAFLGQDPSAKLVLPDIQKVQKALNALLAQADKFYAMALKAVQKKYEIDFAATYQASDTSTALLDATFDLSAAPGALTALHRAIDGDMRQLLLEPIPGVTINIATLTHDINRQSHADLTMPFVRLTSGDVADSLASVSPFEDGGRVLMYKLDATDDARDSQALLHARTVSDSRLALTAQLPVRAGVKTFGAPSASCGYTLAKASTGMASTQLLQELEPLIGEYMPGLFADGKPPLRDWVDALDALVNPARKGTLGETLFIFDVSLPAGVFDAWYQAPESGHDPRYFNMSRALQARLRRMIPFYYFQDPAFYDAGLVADAVLAYGALPPMNGFDGTGGRVGPPKSDIYFDLDGLDPIAALMNTPEFDADLVRAMERIERMLSGLGLADAATSYRFNTDNVQRIARHALHMPNDRVKLPQVLGPLLLFEFELVQGALAAATQLAKLRSQAAADPSAAIAALSDFGDRFVRAFNGRLGVNLIAGAHLRPMGIALMVETARALGQGAALAGKPSGLFRLTVLNGAKPVAADDLLAGRFDPSQVLVRETLTSLR